MSSKVIPVHMSCVGDKIEFVLIPGYVSDVKMAMYILHKKRNNSLIQNANKRLHFGGFLAFTIVQSFSVLWRYGTM